MPYYRRVGEVPHKRHTRFTGSGDAWLAEELVSADGFSAESALLYHRRIPAAIVDSQVWELPAGSIRPNHPLRPRHFRLPQLAAPDWPSVDAVTGRRLVLGNDDVELWYVAAGAPSPLYRNAVGDECVFVQSGRGQVETIFGAITVAEGDYVVLPRGTTHRWLAAGAEPLRLYCIQAAGHVRPARRYLSPAGQFLESAPYCERDLRGPDQPLLADGTDVPVHVLHRSVGGVRVGSVLTYQSHPFDVAGWDGCLYPFAFNVADFEPITGRIHQPPPVHQVFEGPGFVICNFVPRKVDYHPDSIPVPYYHANVDSDEVMFYVAGNYEARQGSGIAPGSVSLHPGGYTHGPTPAAVQASIGAEFFDELAVMVDTFRPLGLGAGGLACEDPGYAWTWSGRGPAAQPG